MAIHSNQWPSTAIPQQSVAIHSNQWPSMGFVTPVESTAISGHPQESVAIDGFRHTRVPKYSTERTSSYAISTKCEAPALSTAPRSTAADRDGKSSEQRRGCRPSVTVGKTPDAMKADRLRAAEPAQRPTGAAAVAAVAECFACCGGSCTARCRKPQSMFDRSVAAAPRTGCESEPIWMPRTPSRDHSDQRT